MSTAVAQPPVPAPHAPVLEPGPSRVYAATAPNAAAHNTVTPTSNLSHRAADNASPTSSSDGSSAAAQRVEGKRSPLSYVVDLLVAFLFFFPPALLLHQSHHRPPHAAKHLHVSSQPKRLL